MDRRRRSERMPKLSRLAFEPGGASCARARLYDRSIHGSLGGRSSARDRETKIQRERSDGGRRSHSRDSTATAFYGNGRTRLSRAWPLGKNIERGGIAANSFGCATRLKFARRALRTGRADHWFASSR